MNVFLNKLPAVKTPKPIIFGAAIFFATFYFWFTQSAQSTSTTSTPHQPEK